jgi:DNA ligase-1
MKFQELIHYFERLEATTKRLEMFEILAELFRKSNAEEADKIIYLSQGQLLPSFLGREIGMSEKLLMRALAGVRGIEPAEVEKVYKQTGDMGETSLRLLQGKGSQPTVKEIYQGLYDLSEISGEGSVEKKISGLRDLFAKVSPEEAKYLARFVAGRLRLGVGDATVLEALALAKVGREAREELERAYNLCSDLGLVARTLFEKGLEGIRRIRVQVGYPIRMALCERLSTAEEIIEKIGQCAVEPKYDGFRCQIHKRHDHIEIFSRNLERTTPMFPEIAEATRRQFTAREAIFEGEALTYNESTGELLPFQITIQRKRKHGVEELAKEFPLKLFAFELLYADGSDYTAVPYSKRHETLNRLIRKDTVIEPAQILLTDNPKELAHFFEEAVEKGLEGIVAKRLDAPYTAGARNFNWIKLKRSYKGELSDTIDVVVVGYFMGKGQRARFGIGTILGAVYDEKSDAFKTVSKIGSGFSEEELTRLKAMLDEIRTPHKPVRLDSVMEPDVWVEPRYVVTVMADEITRSPSHTAGKAGDEPGYALRFPRAQGFLREDKRPEDATTVKEIIELYRMQKHVKLQ